MDMITCAISVSCSIGSSVKWDCAFLYWDCGFLYGWTRPTLEKNVKIICHKSNTIFIVFVSLLLTTVVSKHYNKSVLATSLYYLWFPSFSSLLFNHEENQWTANLKGRFLLKCNRKHIVGEKTIENLQHLSLRSLHKARQCFNPQMCWEFSCYSSLLEHLQRSGAGSWHQLCLSSPPKVCQTGSVVWTSCMRLYRSWKFHVSPN